MQDILLDSQQGYEAKIAAAEALSDIKDQGSLPIIEKVLEQQTNDTVVEYLRKSIKRIKGEDDLPFLESKL